MSFLALAPAGKTSIDPKLLSDAAGRAPVTWFDPDNRALGGIACLSPLALTENVSREGRIAYTIVGRIRLDRRAELQARLADLSFEPAANKSDAALCLHAYAKWGDQAARFIFGDYCFVIYDHFARKIFCARDHFGVRPLAWWCNAGAIWISGSLKDLVSIPSFHARSLDEVWIADFLRHGVSSDPARSIYSSVHRLPPAHTLSVSQRGLAVQRYWSLAVTGPLLLNSRDAYLEEFHYRLDAAMRDRLPAGPVGLFMSGGLDSSTLAAKAVKLSASSSPVFANTWLVEGQSDPETSESVRVARHLGLHHTLVDSMNLRFDPSWQDRPTVSPEPGLNMIQRCSMEDEAKSMAEKATCWLYGEGPDNTLTFEWQSHLRWLAHHHHWALLPGTIARYLASKSLAEWGVTGSSRLRFIKGRETTVEKHAWIRGDETAVYARSDNAWRPEAHANLSSALWPAMFEFLDTLFGPAGIDWRHPYMDLRVLEFMLATPPIPWARHKALIRQAMAGELPRATLRRAKTPLQRNLIEVLLRKQIATMPRMEGEIERFVDVGRLPQSPTSHFEVEALIRVAILNHWLINRHD